MTETVNDATNQQVPTMSDDTTDWTALREFKAVDLTASYVLSWHVNGEALLLELDICLAPQHPFYEEPRPSEDACIRPGVLEFPYCVRLVAANRTADKAAIAGLASRLGLGRINGLRRTGDGIYELQGKFGDVTIHAERPILRLKSLAS
ncbi:hypothetical protein [Woeseia oceani]|uniref:Uncharacterized protein n=1 Tax=Woeseia oceani TaxID=1548547 RepID=A0A193LI04_9GAMM|nr:hypothetical protein [Woeseia oceani]ANO52019.1 hypothetical protein BA177_13150 [Woeseia oceani]